MNSSLLAAVAGVVLLVALFRIFIRHGGKLARLVYQKRGALFSADDRVFFQVLKRAVGGEFEIFGKIRVSDLVQPKKVVARDVSRAGLAAIVGRHFDFVLCDVNTLAVACVIQLHDKTNPAHQPEFQDDALKPVCDSVGLPLVRFPIKAEYSPQEIREKLNAAMSKEPLYLMETNGRKEPRISGIEDLKL